MFARKNTAIRTVASSRSVPSNGKLVVIDEDEKKTKRNTVTPWKRRKIRCLQCATFIGLFIILALTSYGYHRRQQNKLAAQRKKAWTWFVQKNIRIDRRKKKAMTSTQDEFLRQHPDVVPRWRKHIRGSEVENLFEGDVHPEWKPDPDNTLEQAADRLGEIAEEAINWVEEDILEPAFGEETAHYVKDIVHDTLDHAGDMTDELEDVDVWDDVGEHIYDSVNEFLNTTMGTTVNSAMEWMGNSSEWYDWTEWTGNSSDWSNWISNNTDLTEWTQWMGNSSQWMGNTSQWLEWAEWFMNTTDFSDFTEWIGNASEWSNWTDFTEVAEWIENNTDLTNWTDGLSQTTSSVFESFLNFTTSIMEEEFYKEMNENEDISAKELDNGEILAAAESTNRSKPERKHRKRASVQELPEFVKTNAGLLQFAFITHGFPNDETSIRHFEDNVLGALRTYLQHTILFYVVNFSDAPNVDDVCSREHNQNVCERLVVVKILCPGLGHDLGSCCHHDKGLARIAHVYPDFNWYIYHQDDLYFRTGYLNLFVKALPNPKQDAFLLSASPFQAHGEQPHSPKNNGADKESKCSSSLDQVYPSGEPAIIYSNAALKRVRLSYQRYAITQECRAFKTTASSASSIVHWMHQLPVAKLPQIAPRSFRFIGSRLEAGGKVSEMFQSMIAFRVGPGGTNFTESHQELESSKTTIPRPPYAYNFHRPNGFTETETYKRFGPVKDWKNWYVFSPEHCVAVNQTKNQNTTAELK